MTIAPSTTGPTRMGRTEAESLGQRIHQQAAVIAQATWPPAPSGERCGCDLRLVRDLSRSSPHAPRFLVLDTAGSPVQARWPAMLEHLRFVRGEGSSALGEARAGEENGLPGAGGPATGTGRPADAGRDLPGAGEHRTDPARIAAITGGAYLLKPAVSPLISWRRPAI